VILCGPPTACADPNPNRWYCMRGYDGAPPGICPLTICETRGANRPAQPKGTTVTANHPDDLDVPTDGEPGPPCSKCGLPLPPLPVEVKRALTAGLSVELSHAEGECPEELLAQPKGRYFEVRVDVVEVAPRSDEPGWEDREPDPRVTELMSFKHGVRAPVLALAMRPLALGLGEKWAEAEKRAAIADADADGGA